MMKKNKLVENICAACRALIEFGTPETHPHFESGEDKSKVILVFITIKQECELVRMIQITENDHPDSIYNILRHELEESRTNETIRYRIDLWTFSDVP